MTRALAGSIPSTVTVLIVDDEQWLRRLLGNRLRVEGFSVHEASTGAQARAVMDEVQPEIVLMDIQLPDDNGASLMAELKHRYPQTHFIMITAHGSIRSAVQATQRGAADYLTKPFEPDELLNSVRAVLGQWPAEGRPRAAPAGRVPDGSRTSAVNGHAKRHPATIASNDEPVSRDSLVTGGTSTTGGPQSQAMRRTLAKARKAARQNGIVLLLGESGVGKDHMARWIHDNSPRARGPYFALNCAAVSRELAESELFGHEPGAFTGTRGRKRGLIELAEGGTLLLNEIGELDLGLQAKLLSFIDTRCFLRVGGDREVKVNARLVAATNRNLEKEVTAGTFRQDLYFRLDVLPITVPPLRERTADIPGLVECLLDRLTNDLDLPARPSVSSTQMAKLQAYSWPGNIRELRNALERAIVFADGHHLHFELVNPNTSRECLVPDQLLNSGQSLHQITRGVAATLVREALRRCETKQQAAELLGISRHALAHQMKTLGIKE